MKKLGAFLNQPLFYELCNIFGLRFGWYPHLCAISTFYPTLITYQPLLKLLAAFSTEVNTTYTKPQNANDLLTSILSMYNDYNFSGEHFDQLTTKPVLFSKQDLQPLAQGEKDASIPQPVVFAPVTLHSKLLLKSGKLDAHALASHELTNNFWVHRRLNPSVLQRYVLAELQHAKIPAKTNHMEYPFAADIVVPRETSGSVAIFVEDADAKIVGAEHVLRLEIEMSKMYFRAKKWKILEISEQQLPKLLELVDAARK